MIRCKESNTLHTGHFAGEYVEGQTYEGRDFLARKFPAKFELVGPAKKEKAAAPSGRAKGGDAE